MPYIGNAPSSGFVSTAYQDLTGGTGTSHTLDHPVGTAQDIEVYIGNVRQEPGDAYTVSGTTLTLTTAVAAADDFYVVFQNKAIGTATHPSTANLNAADGVFTGILDASGPIEITGNVPIYENTQTVNADYTITNNRNAMSAGPITVASGVTVTVGSGETWTVV